MAAKLRKNGPKADKSLALQPIHNQVFAYNLFLVLYQLGIRLAAVFNAKARAWLDGRAGLLKKVQIELEGNRQKLIWIHSASLGEFEQGRTLIEAIKKQYPQVKILVTFFSPSGYEVRKNYKGADHVFYLPMDGKKNAEKFIEIIQPSLAIFIKYELWYYYLNTLHQKKIPTILISAIVLPTQSYFGVFGKFFQNMLNLFSHIFVQDQQSLTLLSQLNITAPCSIGGDTRFDRVHQIANDHFSHAAIEYFCKESRVLIAGSTWTEDENALAAVQEKIPDLKFIIAPHEIHASHIASIKKSFKDAVCLSEFNNDPSTKVLIIDSIGMLSKIYRYATLAYVGGGFNASGIHNVLEAAVYGKIVLWGPHYNRSAEASTMLKIGCGYSFQTHQELFSIVNRSLQDEQWREEKNQQASNFVKDNIGATSRIMVFLQDSTILA